ncbi:iron ABC transporter permease [Neptuniibacter sp.]|uniref:FecCD family ABC transporter permease n=1 Tax=Neptuniibacter sp. TaxID=1962643 RepID=UPI00261A9091|nr:iron ABC transporter permease [Neptuniibacter sp.]MCP4596619.1 iron ABC transporter permease [Neptuniibacter sp.]
MTASTYRNNKALIFTLISAMLVTCLFAGLVSGPANIPVSEVPLLLWQNLLNIENTTSQWMVSVLVDVRLPRLLVGALAGGCLAICGAVMQGMFRNPLASPSILGVSSGASLGAVIAIFLGLATVSVWILPLFAFAGAGLTLFIVYRIASQRGHAPISTLLMAGIAMAALNSALSSLILAMSLDSWGVGQSILYWTMGGLDGRTWDHVLLIAPLAIFGIVLLLRYSRSLDALLLGEVHASSIGIDVAKTRRDLLLITSFLVGAAISVCGGISFIGLVVPHILRMILGPHHRYLLPASAIGGALALVAADLLLRSILPEKTMPLGVITASFGAPFFLFLLLRQRRSGKL